MDTTLLYISQFISSFMVIITFLTLIIKPIREFILGTKTIRDSQKCLLRSQMLHTYYKNKEFQKIRQYELEDFIYCYKAYKAMGGNSFIDRIYEEIKKWSVET